MKSPIFDGGSTRPINTDMVAWYRLNTGITVTGSGVSKWADQSGNGRDLNQTTDTNRPALQLDGSILFDGNDNKLVTGSLSISQPITHYILFKQITWASGDNVFNGLATAMVLTQAGTTPALRINGGSAVGDNTNLVLDTYGVVATVFNGASSLIQVNNTTPNTGNAGANIFDGFSLGGVSAYSNIQVKEVIIYNSAHDANQRFQNIRYLNRINQL